MFDSGLLSFASGFNLVVGANSVGKSSLLACLAAKFGGEPHRSIHMLPTRDGVLNQFSRVELGVVASGEEIRRLILGAGDGQRYFPWPGDEVFEGDSSEMPLNRLLSASAVPINLSARAQAGQLVANQWMLTEYPATRLYSPLVDGTNRRMLRVQVSGADRTITPLAASQNQNPEDDFGLVLGQLIMRSVYRFQAERLSLGDGAYGTSTELSSDARNLPEVLNILQSNPRRWEDFCTFVREVFPQILWVSVRPHPQGGNRLEVLVWQVDPGTQRDDLTIPLTQCGTGVGQVLAILYVAKISEQPRTIIIDEPGSFLHPGASRALMGILKRFSQHQYIIATHSPEVINEIADASVTIIRWQDSQSVMEQFPRTTTPVAAAALTAVGARLSDVFGFDKVLWVEGPSDALSIKALLGAIGRTQPSIAILPVRDTGSFKRRKIAEILELYRTLAMGNALLPPAVLFLFDRDGRGEQEIEDVVRESRGKVRFLDRRLYENYLLNPCAVARLYSESGAEFGIATTEAAVMNWLTVNGGRHVPRGERSDILSQAWLEVVDGATLLEDLFVELSECRLKYEKTTHSPRLTVLVHEMDPSAGDRILSLIGDVIG